MNKYIKQLAVVLVLQLLIIGYFWVLNGNTEEPTTGFLSLNADEVTVFSVADADARVTLEKKMVVGLLKGCRQMKILSLVC